MGRLRLAWRVLTNKNFANQAAALASSTAIESKPEPPQPEPLQPPARSEALTLLAALQRDARFSIFSKSPSTALAMPKSGPLSAKFIVNAERL